MCYENTDALKTNIYNYGNNKCVTKIVMHANKHL